MWFLRNGQFWSNPIRQIVERRRERGGREMDSETEEERFGILNVFVCVTWVPIPPELIPLCSED